MKDALHQLSHNAISRLQWVAEKFKSKIGQMKVFLCHFVTSIICKLVDITSMTSKCINILAHCKH